MLSTLGRYLSVKDLAYIQAVDTATNKLFEDAVAWWWSASSCVPNFNLSVELFSKGRRGQFMPLFRALADPRVWVQPRLEVSVSDMAQAKRMAKLLDSSQQAACAHLARGGAFAEAVPDHESPEAGLCLAVGPLLMVAGHRHVGKRSLRLHLAIQGDALLATARTDSRPPEAIELPRDRIILSPDQMSKHQPLTLEVVSLSSELTLSLRGGQVRTDLEWQPMSAGLLAPTRGRAAARAALAEGIPCLVCLRDGVAAPSANMVASLQIDRPRAAR